MSPSTVTPTPHPTLLALLELVVNEGASDLHLRPGAVAKVRVAGRLVDATTSPLDAATVSALVGSSMTSGTQAEFAARLEADYALVIEGVGRFRVNAFRTRGADACVMRRVRDTAISLEDMGMPKSIGDLALRTRGLVLVTGPTGSGKSTTLAGMVDLINRAARRPHPDPRGPDRGAAPGPRRHRHPARARHRHPELVRRAPRGDAAGPGRHPHRRAARHRDRARRASPRPRPATSCWRRCTPTTPARPCTA